MHNRNHKPTGNSIIRLVIVVLSVLFQAGWLLLLVERLNRYSTWISLFTSILSIAVVLRLYSKNINTAMKLPWITLILVFPVMGLSMYLL